MGIRVNLQGREAEGIVSPGAEYEEVRERILADLRDLRHPETGQPLLTAAFRREELFSGPHLADAPDVLYVLDDGACAPDVHPYGPIFQQSSWGTWTGTHRREGVFIASGPHISAGRRLGPIEILDVAPAVLHLFAIGIPEHVEGKIPAGLLTEEAAAIRPRLSLRPPHPPGDPGEGSEPYTDEEARQVEERLRGLGYL
jgi:predicted AlkP superfamily phosphohydrolase/phosphomutase